MAKKWTEVIANPEFQKLSPDEQEAARAQYWNQVVVPQLPEGSHDAARAQFDAQFGPSGSRIPKAPEMDAQPIAAGPKRWSPEWIASEGARQVGLTARHAIAGVAAIPAMASDAVTGIYNTAADAVAGKGNGFRFTRAGQALQDTLTRVGLPEPADKVERIVGDASAAALGVLPTMAAGQHLAGAANPIIAAVGRGLSAGTPVMQGAGAATGAGASATVRENGGGIGAQLAAGLIGGVAPSGLPTASRMAARGLLRGGEAGRQRVADNIKLFEEAAGTTPSLAQATEGRVARALESTLAKAPGSAGVMARFAQKQSDDMQAAVQRITDSLADDASAAAAGEAIQRGVAAFKSNFKTGQQALYRELDSVLPKETPITVNRTREALAAMNEGIDGAPALSAWFRNSKIQGIEKALASDLELAATPVGQSSVMPQAPRPAALPYEAIRKLRTLVGNEITDGSLISDVPRSKWRALYGALSEDLGDAAKAAGPKAEEAWAKANDFTSQHMQRLDELSTIVGRDAPERVFKAAVAGTADGATVAKRVMSALPMEEKQAVAAAVLQRMGRAKASVQGADADAFSPETFLTSFAKMNPAAREAIFGQLGDNVEDGLRRIAKLAESRREGAAVLANPSGTAAAAANIGAWGGGLGALGAAAATTSVAPVLAVGGPLAAANLAARSVTSPSIVRIAASRARVTPGLGASAVTAPLRLNTAADLPPEQREVGQVYETPRGLLVWRGNGWEPAQ